MVGEIIATNGNKRLVIFDGKYVPQFLYTDFGYDEWYEYCPTADTYMWFMNESDGLRFIGITEQ